MEVGWFPGWRAGSLDQRTGILSERVADVLHRRTVIGRASPLCESAAALGSLRVRAALNVRAEMGNWRERAGGTVVGQTRHVVGLGT